MSRVAVCWCPSAQPEGECLIVPLPGQYTSDTIVGLLLKVLTPLMLRMFTTDPVDLALTAEQGSFEFPMQAYHVGATSWLSAFDACLFYDIELDTREDGRSLALDR